MAGGGMRGVATGRWFPLEGRATPVSKIEAGMIVAIDSPRLRFAPWRVHEIAPRDDRWAIILRPVGDLYDLAEHNVPVSAKHYAMFSVLPEHYAVCVKCGQIPPCADTWAGAIAERASEWAERFEVPGVCPSCQESVTRRQESVRFEENLHVPFGPSVVFHLRSKCRGGAISYDEAVAKANNREPRLSCTGFLVQHRDGTRACTNITCPGWDKRHRAFALCHVLREKCNRPECWEGGDRHHMVQGR